MSADVQVAQLIATGPQDVWLSGDPQVSFFRSMYRRHVPFGMSLEKMNFAQDSVTFDRRGDLLGACYITASDPVTNVTLATFPISSISRVDLFIGGQQVDSQDTTFSTQVWPVTEACTVSERTAPTSFYPLHFFFCKDWSRAFPLVALEYHDVVIRIRDASPAYKYTLWANMVHLAEPERAWYKRQPHRILITRVQTASLDQQRDWGRFGGPIKYLATPGINYTKRYVYGSQILGWTFNGTTTDYITGLSQELPVQISSNDNMFGDVKLTSNSVLYFPGTTGSYLQWFSGGSFQSINLTTTNVFAESWIYMNTFSPSSIIFSRNFQNLGGAGCDFCLSVDGSGNVQAAVSNTNSLVTTAVASSAVTLKTWTYVAFGWNFQTKTVSAWINGGLPVSASFTGTATNYTGRIYSGWDGGSSYMNGYIGDMRAIVGCELPVTISAPDPVPFARTYPSYISTGLVAYSFPSQTNTYTSDAINFINVPGQSGNSYVNYNLSLGSIDRPYTYSVSAWLYSPNTANPATQVPITIAGLNRDGDWRFQIGGPTAAFRYNIRTGPDTYSLRSIGGQAITAGQWFHMVGIVNETSTSTTMTYYRDGVLAGSSSTNYGNLRIFNRLGVGAPATGQQYNTCYNGYVADVRIYDTELTASQVNTLYNEPRKL
jgi:hypothetical protein